MIKFNKILKGVISAASLVSLAGVSVLAQDSTNLTLNVTGGALTVTSPASVALTAVTIGTTDQSSTADVTGVNVTDTRGSNAGWTLTMKVSNLSLTTPDDNDNILVARAESNLTTNTSDVYLSLTNSNLTDASGGTGAPETELALSANPVFDTMIDTNSTPDDSALDATGETASMTILEAQVDEGAGSYDFDTNVSLTIPAYGNYDLTGKVIGGGDYTGVITYDFL